MPYRYAISDPHGCLDALGRALDAVDLSGKNHLYLLGDYIPHVESCADAQDFASRSAQALTCVRAFEASHPGNVTVLAGNHELYLLELEERGLIELSPDLKRWMKGLEFFVECDEQVYVHAGIDEAAGEWWRWGSEPWYFCSKHPATFGRFAKDVIAGHVGAPGLAGDPDFEGAYWDGESHYYVDASTEVTGRITILRYDVARRTYAQQVATAEGVSELLPVVAQS